MEKENQRILEFAMQQNEREQERLQAKIAQQEKFANRQGAIGDALAAKQRERDEMDRIRQVCFVRHWCVANVMWFRMCENRRHA